MREKHILVLDSLGAYYPEERDAKARTLLGKPTPFVGRDRELATLEALFEECAGEPVARAVLVTGFPGAGKSRLVAEMMRQIPRFWCR